MSPQGLIYTKDTYGMELLFGKEEKIQEVIQVRNAELGQE